MRKQNINIDVGGRCGKIVNPDYKMKNCWKGKGVCTDKDPYKFYVAIEHSICKDYITEKYFRSLDWGLVPIVVGGSNNNYLDHRITVPGSFIDTLDFQNMTELANYIKYLDGNDTAYNEYHKWREDYKIVYESRFCQICKKLWENHDGIHKHDKKYLLDIGKFWDRKLVCTDPFKTYSRFISKP